MSEERDEPQGRAETTPHGPPLGGQNPYQQAGYAQSPYGQPQYGQPAYGQDLYGQAPYGQDLYGQPPYGQPPYGQPAFGAGQPARPGTVITAAVLGLVLSALGLLTTVLFLAGGALVDDLADLLDESSNDSGLTGSDLDGARAGLVVLALLALAWTVVMVWGSVLALKGRSRVLLIVGASISVATTGLVFLAGLVGAVSDPGEDGQVGGVLFLLVVFLAPLATLVLLCLRSAARFFAAHRQRRALLPR